ncbi:MAG TPA: RpiB/LacA/LacB family sugar-phosphate isomerase [Candidatus Paceibacterota bacterium]|nr:RpiB/LacA/LacB family sugar-phosphate isomerase [Candidatus Paceibacterota bacterium]
MKIYLGTDHAGFELKEQIKTYLKGKGLIVEDQGAFALDPEDDYTDYVKIVAKMVHSDPESVGIILGGSGQGEAICANRYKGIRAVVYYGGSLDIIKLSREHNNANILSFGARFVKSEEAKQVIDLWLTTPFSEDERHARRIHEIDDDENLGHII